MKKTNIKRININGKSGMVQRKPLKSLTAFFLSLHVLFGIDYGFAYLFKEKVRSFLKTYATFLHILIIIVVLNPFTTLFNLFWYWITAVESVSYFILLKRTKYSVFNLMIDIHNLEGVTINNETFGVITFIYSYLMYALKLSNFFMRCFYGSTLGCRIHPDRLHQVFIVSSNIIDFYPISTFVMSYYIYTVVKQMKRILEWDMDIAHFLRLYKIVADTCDKIRPLYDKIIILELLINIPKLMTITWLTLLYLNINADWYSHFAQWFHFATLLFIPPVIVQATNMHLDSIKIFLNEIWIDEKDRNKRRQIANALTYMKTRPLKHLIWGIIPIDLHLIISIVSIFVSYFIVIVQLSHLYD